MRIYGTFVLIAAGAVALPAFAQPPVRVESRRFIMVGQPRQVADPIQAERFLEGVEQLLGLRVPGPIRYAGYSRAEEIDARLGVFTPSITFPRARQIHTTRPLSPADVVRVVAGQVGHPGDLFTEGLAIALGDRGLYRGRKVGEIVRKQGARPQDIEALATSFGTLPLAQAAPVAGSFVGWLLETEGPPRLTRFFRMSENGGEVRVALYAAYGRSLDSLASSWARSVTSGPSAPVRFPLLFHGTGLWAAPRTGTQGALLAISTARSELEPTGPRD